MKLILETEINELLKYQAEYCVSIFLPTHIGGKEVLNGEDQRHLKTLWDKCRNQLESHEVDSEKIESIARPIRNLIEDDKFWRHQSHGLAVFSAPDFFEYKQLPVKFEAHTYIGNHFYVRSLAPSLSKYQKFYVLELQLDRLKFFEASEYSITEIEIHDLVPQNMKEVVGFDYEEKHLEMRNQQQNDAGGKLFHGHGGANRDRNEEILKYFQAIDRGLNNYLNTKDAPLVVFCQDNLFPIYQEANSYSNLYEKPIPGNPNDVEVMGLHEKAVELLKDYFEADKRKKLKLFKEAKPGMKSDLAHDIVPFAIEGKIDTLLLENRADLWGSYDEITQKVSTHDEREKDSLSLTNLAARQVLKNDGTVYLIDSAFMPNKKAKMNAILRYS